MIASRRTKEFLSAVLVWSAVLATTPGCFSFSFAPNAARVSTSSGAEGIGKPITVLHAGPLIEELESTDASSENGGADASNFESLPLTSAEDSLSEKNALPSLSSLFPKNRQVLEFVEPQTNVTVMLIGSMHYNPASIQLVEKTVDELGATNKLGSVIIESCDIRWNKTQEMMDKKKPQRIAATSNNGAEQSIEYNPNEKDFLGNEMRAAWEVATKYYRPTVLGDQQINVTMDALKASLKDTASDIFLGGPSGWKRSADEIAVNWKKTIPVSAGENENNNNHETRYLNAFAFFDPRLLISLPVSLVKYPLSFLVKDPIPVGTVFAIIAFLNFYADIPTSDFSFEDWVAAATTPRDYPLSDYVLSFLIAFLETVVFARLLLKPLLADRNEILARSVLDQCLIYANNDDDANNGSINSQGTENKLPFGNWFQNFLSPLSSEDASSASVTGEEAPVYVPGSDPESMSVAAALASSSQNPGSSSEGKVVVAVLGMAHCNGVMKLLREQKV